MTLTQDELQQVFDAQRSTMKLELTQDEIEQLVEVLEEYIDDEWPDTDDLQPLLKSLKAVRAWGRRTNGKTMTLADLNAGT